MAASQQRDQAEVQKDRGVDKVREAEEKGIERGFRSCVSLKSGAHLAA